MPRGGCGSRYPRNRPSRQVMTKRREDLVGMMDRGGEDGVGLGGRRVPGRCDRPSTGMDALLSGRCDGSAWSEGPGR